eukprot:55548-Eustigmatos_ZCMA.PRE.1
MQHTVYLPSARPVRRLMGESMSSVMKLTDVQCLFDSFISVDISATVIANDHVAEDAYVQ